MMENVLINARIASLSCTPEAARAALAAVGLSDYEDVPAGQLSQGQRRRVALARLWLSESVPLWILDEPFTALDVKGCRPAGGLGFQACCRGRRGHAGDASGSAGGSEAPLCH